MIDRLKRYPARLQAAVVALVSLLVSFGVSWTVEQSATLTAFTATLIALFLEGVPKPTKK